MPRARVLTASATARTKKGRKKFWHINGQSASATARTKKGQAPTTCAGACRRQIAACMRQPINTDTTALPCPLNAKIFAGMAGDQVELCHPRKRLAQGAGGLLGWWSGFAVAYSLRQPLVREQAGGKLRPACVSRQIRTQPLSPAPCSPRFLQGWRAAK